MVSIGLESFILNVLSRFYNEDRQGGSRDKLPGGHTPGGGRRRGASPVGSSLGSRKIEKGNVSRKYLTSVFLYDNIALQEVSIMKGRDIVKSIMEQKKVTNADMAARLQITQAALWDRLNTKKTKDIPSSTLTEMLRQLDYKLIVVPRNTRLPADSFEID